MSEKFYGRLKNTLNQIKKDNVYKEYKYLTSPMNGKADVEGYGKSIILCSNNYLGFDDKPEITEAGKTALDKYGAGASSVRFICGTFDIHRELELLVADFLGTESSVTYTSCWAANTASIPALLNPGDCVISDSLNHASIIDGCKMVQKGVDRHVYSHSDMNSLEEKLILARENNCETVLIVTDGVFSMEGDVAKLPEIIKLKEKYGAVLMIDESHATGVIGKTGRGTKEYYDITDGVDIISGTFGKALGGAGGGFIASSKEVCEILTQKSRPSLFSNSLPPVLCAIAQASINYLRENPSIVASLKDKTIYARDKIKKAGLNPLDGDSAIIPIIVGDTATSIKISQKMMDMGVFAIGFGYPVVPENAARIRLQISDALTYEDIDFAVEVIAKAI